MRDVLDRRALNRALLARQLLLERARLSPLEALERLVGLQAQSPEPPYYGLWSRVEGFDADDLGALVADGRAVRIALMRSTIHLVGREDAARLRRVVQPALDAALRASYGKALDGVDPVELVAAARALLAERPLASSELGRALLERWGDRDASALANAARTWIPLVQIPPRGVWGRSGRAVHLPLDARPGVEAEGDGAPDALVIRYLRAFGPATVADVRQWSGLTGLDEVLERLRPRLRTFLDETGRELFDVHDGPLPDPDTPAPVRFTAPFDNIVLAHADRTRIMDDAFRAALGSSNGMVPGTVLLDGFVAATWRVGRLGRVRSLVVEPLRRLSRSEKAAARAEGEGLLRFIGGGAADGRFEIGPVG